jgi:hypothetical protein
LAELVQPPQPELPKLAAEQCRVPEIPGAVRLELVDEHRKRRLVMELETTDFERHPRQAGELRRASAAVDPLDATRERRQRPGDTVDRPDPVELVHAQ